MCGTDNRAFYGASQERVAPNQQIHNIQHHIDAMRHSDTRFGGTINKDTDATDEELQGLINAVQNELVAREVNKKISEALAEGKRIMKRDRAVLDEEIANFWRIQSLHKANGN